MITAQSRRARSQLNHGPGPGSVTAGCDHFGHRELTVSLPWAHGELTVSSPWAVTVANFFSHGELITQYNTFGKTLRTRKIGSHFADDASKIIFWFKIYIILIQISLEIVRRCLNNNKPVLVEMIQAIRHYRRCSNYIFILDLAHGFNGLGKGN